MLKALHMHLPEYVELLDIGEGLQANKIVVLYDKDYLMTFFTQAEAHEVEGQEHTTAFFSIYSSGISTYYFNQSSRTYSCIRIASTIIRLQYDAEIRHSPCLE